MKRFLAGLAVGTALLCMSGQDASATLINFDNVASGTNISTYYSGVTFSAILCPGGAATCGPSTNPVYAVASTHAVSPGNVVSISSTADNFGTLAGGAIEATFSALQSSVSITTDPWIAIPEGLTAWAKPYISAFDSADNFLGITYTSQLIDPSIASTPEVITITSAGNIKKVRFTVQDKSPHTKASFDNLVFTLPGFESSVNPITGGPGPGGGGTQVPEPSTLLLLGSGMVGLAMTRIRKFRKS